MKAYVIIRYTPFSTEVYKVCTSEQDARQCIAKSAYPKRDFIIVTSEFYKGE